MAAFHSSLIAIPRDNLISQVDISRFGSKHVIFKALNHQKPLVSSHRDRRFTIRASIRYSSVALPLKLESPIGQFLSEMLKNHPHLVHAAVEQQLEQLQTDDSNNAQNDDELESLLYKRIAELKANQRGKALEEILYTIVAQKFNDANAPLVPNIIAFTPCKRVETWPNDQNKLFRLHSPESYEMINNHLSHILGDSDYDIVAEINKARIGQVYAASAIYGYFLRRVDERYQMDKKMTTGIGHDDFVSQVDTTSRLKKYVTSFNKETLQTYAKIRSKEAVSIIEKHTAALFGRAKVAVTPQGTYDDSSSKDEKVDISFGDFRTLILEGLTFGSFLWDAESYVNLKCHLVAN